MEEERDRKKRLTLDLEMGFQRRLKSRAALKGLTMREYCLSAIEKQLEEDEVEQEPYIGSRARPGIQGPMG